MLYTYLQANSLVRTRQYLIIDNQLPFGFKTFLQKYILGLCRCICLAVLHADTWVASCNHYGYRLYTKKEYWPYSCGMGVCRPSGGFQAQLANLRQVTLVLCCLDGKKVVGSSDTSVLPSCDS